MSHFRAVRHNRTECRNKEESSVKCRCQIIRNVVVPFGLLMRCWYHEIHSCWLHP